MRGREQGYAILVVTARKHRWRHHTAWFLALNDIPSDGLWMRPDHDTRSADLVKSDILRRIRNLGYEVVIAFDDNPKVVAFWEANEIPTVVVPGWVTATAELDRERQRRASPDSPAGNTSVLQSPQGN